MCRWFAYISNSEKCLLEDVLILPDHSISKQVDSHYLPGLWPWETADTSDDNEAGLQNVYDRNFRNNSDGLGIAWYSSTRMEFTEPANIIPLPTLYKTLGHPSTDPNFISIYSTTATNALFAHIRAASPGLPVNEMNCHPFAFGRCENISQRRLTR
jgi:glutamine amidotransferase